MDIFDFFEGIRDDIVIPIFEPIMEAIGYEDQDIYQFQLLTQRVIPDEDLPETSQLNNEILNATRQGTSLALAFKRLLLTGAVGTVDTYTDYVDSSYIDGLPSCGFKTPPVHAPAFNSIVASALTLKGYTVVNDTGSITVKAPTQNELALAYLQDTYDYKQSIVLTGDTYVYYNVVSSSAGYQAKLLRDTDQAITYLDLPDYDSLSFIYYYVYSATVTDGSIEFAYKYTLPFDYAGESDEYLEMVESAITGADEDAFKTLPIITIRKDSAFPTEELNEEWYTTAKEALAILNFDFDEIITAIGTNESIDDVTDAFLICGISLYSDTTEGALYLYFYFKMMYSIMALGSYESYTANRYSKTNTHYIRFESGTFNLVTFFDYIRLEYVEENIGDIGTITKTFDIRDPIGVKTGGHYEEDEHGRRKLVDQTTTYYEDSRLIFKRQVTVTHCEKITIHGLQSLVNMTHEDGKKYGLVQPLVAEGSEGTQFFNIPLSQVFLELYSIDIIEKLVLESLNYVFFASVMETIDWYATEAFFQFVSAIITIVAIIVFAYSAQDFGLFELAQQILVQYALKEILVKIIEVNTLTTEQLGVLAVVYAYASYQAGSGFKNWSMTAVDVLSSVPAFSEAITTYVGIESELLQDEFDQFQDDYKEKQEALEAAWDSIDMGNSGMDPLDLIKRPVVKYEMPKDFYERAICTTTTEISLDYINAYHRVSRDVTMIPNTLAA